MPTYEYHCQKCGHRFDQFQTITASPLSRCPKKCKGKIRRVISGGSGVLFKGSGFYATDYRSSSYKEKANKEKASKEKADKEKSSVKGSDACSGTPSTCEKPSCPSKN